MDKRNNVTAGREGGPRTSRQSSAPTRSSERRRGGGGSRPRSRGSRSSESRRQGGPERRDRERNERPRTVEDSNEEKVFLDQLQEWAQETSRKQLTDLEAEFERLQNLPRPEPSPEFVR